MGMRSRFGYYSKASLLVLLVFVGTNLAVLWKTRVMLTDDKLGFLADSAMKQVAPLKRLVQNRFDEHKANLVRLATSHQSATDQHSRSLGDYDVVALMESSGGGQWTPSWFEKSQLAKPEAWPAGYEQTLLQSLPYGKVKDGETVWTRVSDQRGLPIFAEIISVEIQNPSQPGAAPQASGALPDDVDYASVAANLGRRAVIVGFASLDPLADVTEEYIGSTNNVFIVDDKGYVASHVNKAYLGSLFSEDPIVHEIVSAKKTAATGRYEDLDSRPVLGHFERIDRTNLYTVITTPLKPVGEFISLYERTVMMIGGLGCVLGLLALWLLGRAQGAREQDPLPLRDPNQLSGEATPAVNLPVDLPSAPPENTVANANFGETLRPLGREAPSRELAEGFAAAIKEPILAILGHAQLAKVKTGDPELKSHAESIEREARRADEIVGKLASAQASATEEPSSALSESLNLITLINEVVDAQAQTLKEDGIRVERHLHPVPRLRGSAEQIKSTLAGLIDNAVEAMLKRPKKTLKIDLDFDGTMINLDVSDTGIGMSRDVQARAFEPFFKEFTSPSHAGMGLAFAQIAIRRLGGSCKIESSPGEGAKFKLSFPVGELEKRDFETDSSSRVTDLSGTQVKTDLPIHGKDHLDEFTKSIYLQEPTAIKPDPRLQSVENADSALSAALESYDLDVGDEDEAFASVALNRVSDVTLKSPPPPPPPPGERGEPFAVKIRRPRTRS